MSALITSKGYSLMTQGDTSPKISKKAINKDDSAYQHTATLAELITADSSFAPSAEMITIVFKKLTATLNFLLQKKNLNFALFFSGY